MLERHNSNSNSSNKHLSRCCPPSKHRRMQDSKWRANERSNSSDRRRFLRLPSQQLPLLLLPLLHSLLLRRSPPPRLQRPLLPLLWLSLLPLLLPLTALPSPQRLLSFLQ